jgi:hypothetical protein
MDIQWHRRHACVAAVLVLAGCAAPHGPMPAAQALQSIDGADLLRHVRTLASDEFEGRAPATRGERLTVEYLVGEFKRAGLAPGNPDGSFVQKVPLVGVTTSAEATFRAGERKLEMKHKQGFLGGSYRLLPEVAVADSELVFVGYGVVAPEYGWDDYKGFDVRGKTLLMLRDDPQVADPSEPTKLDPRMFRGEIKTYYSTGDHKREVAVPRGAAAAIAIHEDAEPAMGFDVYLSDADLEGFELRDETDPRWPVGAVIDETRARQLLALAGQDFDALRQAARRADFRPLPLGIRASLLAKSRMRPSESHNVVARIEGSDPALKDELIIYTAHWDHLGRDPSLATDQIFNGALDNASGVAALLEVAQAFAQLPRATKRSVLFIATTAEEQGLLGAKHYVQQPLYPLAKTVIVINFDGMPVWGRTSNFDIVGHGETTIDATLAEVARSQGKEVSPDSLPLLGLYYRSDQYQFIRAGVPAIWPRRGSNYIDKPPGFGQEKLRDYIANHYHKVSDEVKDDWDLSGAVELARFAFAAGYRLAQGDAFPQWLPGSEFKAKRDAMMAGQPR